MELSKRLHAVAGLVTEGASVADIGTDHGYIPIYLIQERIASKVIALDVKKGPLERARMHIIGHGLKGQIETRLSDGLREVAPGEVDTMIAAGMGGGLVIHILEDSPETVKEISSFILQPQSEIDKVRRYLNEHGYRIVEERMVEESGKFYPMMRAVHGKEEAYEEYEYLYGKRLVEKKDPVLGRYLQREQNIRESILEQLQRHKNSATAREREKEVQEEWRKIRQALAHYEAKQEVTDEVPGNHREH